MLRIARTGILFVFITYLLSSAVWSEETRGEEGYEAYSLGEIFVKGEKPPVTQETTVTNIITAAEIKATNSRTVAEALTYVPGVRVTSGNKNEPNVSIRGIFDQSRILVMIDGVPYYETKYGKLDLNQFTTSNIARIEVTKGAASVLYGANALGGVINIITRQAAGKPAFDLNIEGGEVDYFKTSLSHGMNTGKINYWLNYEHSQAHGWRMSDDYLPRPGTVTDNRTRPATVTNPVIEDGGTRNQSDYVTDNLWAKFGITPTEDSEYSINFHYITREKGNPPKINEVRISSATFSNFYRYKTYDDWGIDLSGQQKAAEWLTLKGKFFFHNHVDELDSFGDPGFNEFLARSKFKDYIVGGSLIAECRTAEWNSLRLSFNYKGDSHKQRDTENASFDRFFSYTGSAGVEDEINIGNNFKLVAGISYDWFDVSEAVSFSGGQPVEAEKPANSPDDFNPMVGAEYSFNESTKVFASVARKTRFPTLNSLYASRGGNVDLNAESAVNYTVGVSRSFGNFAWGELAFFYHDITDLIDRAGSNRDDPFVNIGKVELYGVEANTEFYPLTDLVLRLAYNYNNASDQTDYAGKTSDKVRNVPEHKLDLGANYTIPYLKTRIDVNGLLFSSVFSQVKSQAAPNNEEIQTAGYFFLNARVTQKLLKNFEAYLAVNNIFDRNYEPEAGFPAQGRNIFGGITARF